MVEEKENKEVSISAFSRFNNSIKRIRRNHGIAFLCAATVAIGGGFTIGYAGGNLNPHKDKPIVSDYRNAEKKLEQLTSLGNLPYRPLHVDPSLESIFDNEKVDEATKLVKSDLEKLEKNPEIKAYNNWVSKGVYGVFACLGAGALIFLTAGVMNGVYQDKAYKRFKQELDQEKADLKKNLGD